jgi:hypothetical protein
MIVAVIILAWLLVNTMATLIIICIDEGTPVKASDWVALGLSCILSPLTILFIIQPITTWITKIKKRRRLRK